MKPLLNVARAEEEMKEREEEVGDFRQLLRLRRTSASTPEIPRKTVFHNFYQKKGVDLTFAGCCISNWAYLLKYELNDE